MNYKIYLDGVDQTDLITGKGPSKKRKEFYYVDAAKTTLHGLRYGDWKFLFKKQDKWFDGVQKNMVTPLITSRNLDPLERFQEARGFDDLGVIPYEIVPGVATHSQPLGRPTRTRRPEPSRYLPPFLTRRPAASQGVALFAHTQSSRCRAECGALGAVGSASRAHKRHQKLVVRAQATVSVPVTTRMGGPAPGIAFGARRPDGPRWASGALQSGFAKKACRPSWALTASFALRALGSEGALWTRWSGFTAITGSPGGLNRPLGPLRALVYGGTTGPAWPVGPGGPWGPAAGSLQPASTNVAVRKEETIRYRRIATPLHTGRGC